MDISKGSSRTSEITSSEDPQKYFLRNTPIMIFAFFYSAVVGSYSGFHENQIDFTCSNCQLSVKCRYGKLELEKAGWQMINRQKISKNKSHIFFQISRRALLHEKSFWTSEHSQGTKGIFARWLCRPWLKMFHLWAADLHWWGEQWWPLLFLNCIEIEFFSM